MAKRQSDAGVKSRLEILEPQMYDVIFLNDDYTTMDFVISVLVGIFGKTSDVAYDIMMEVHLHGEAVAGTYTYDIAKSKMAKATEAAEFAGFPLRIRLRQH